MLLHHKNVQIRNPYKPPWKDPKSLTIKTQQPMSRRKMGRKIVQNWIGKDLNKVSFGWSNNTCIKTYLQSTMADTLNPGWEYCSNPGCLSFSNDILWLNYFVILITKPGFLFLWSAQPSILTNVAIMLDDY